MAVELLLALLASAVEELTVAVLVIGPVDADVTVIVTVAVAPLAMLPRLQVTFLPAVEQLPCVVVAELMFRLFGGSSDDRDAGGGGRARVRDGQGVGERLDRPRPGRASRSS